MTLDEAIKHCKEVAKQQEVKANELYKAKDFEESRDCIWCSKEHEQLAEWLKELKKFSEQQPYEKFESTKDHIYKLAGDYKCWDNRLTEDEAVELCHILEQEPQTFEWCHDCSEYDHDKHCCPRYNGVIRKAVEEMKQEPKTGWIPVSEKLPEDRREVLVTAYWHETYQVMMASYYGDGLWWCVPFNNTGKHEQKLKPKAWSPLPEPYEPQESEEKE